MSCDLTVCICAYNAEKYIAETLESLSKQTFKDFKLLIVNDCSTDRTVEIAEAFADSNWGGFEIISLPENGGLARARRVAEDMCRTEFICFVDADDVPYFDAIEKMYRRIKSDGNCMAVSGYCEYISPDSKSIGGGIFIGPVSKEEFMQQAADKKLMFIPPFNISRIEYLRKAGGRAVDGFPDGKVRYQDMCEDLDLWTRMSDFYKHGKYIVVLSDIILKYRKMASSVSANSRAMSMRIRHIKFNLLRRRNNEPELKFVDYIAQLSRWQKIKYAYSDWASGLYKQAGFYYLNKNWIGFAVYFIGAALFNPGYVFQKFQKNIIPSFRKK